MSIQPKAKYVEAESSEQATHDYLVAHPDFFEHHATLLSNLHLPHATGGAVSLVERQISVLRQKDLKLEKKLRDLIEIARANDLLAAKIHELAMQLLATPNLTSTIAALEEGMRSGFGADQAVLVLFGNPDDFDDIDAGRFLHVIKRDANELTPFKTFLSSPVARCGQIRDAQREFLFHDDASDIGSAALIPLAKGAEIGFLGIGSNDTDRFHPGMSTDFLTRLGDLIAGALQRY